MTTTKIPIQTTNTGALDDRIDILFRELELAIRWKRPSILLAVFRSEHIQNQVGSILKSRLLTVGQEIHTVKIENNENSDIPAYLTNLTLIDKKVIFVEGFKSGDGQKNIQAYHSLNIGRDYFINRQVRVVFLLSVEEANDLARYAPEFWGYRHRVVEFLEQIDPALSPLRSLGSLWQGIGNFSSAMDDIDNRIALRDSLLAELPDRNESTSVRADLLISLGVLHWQKGNVEKAIGLSRSALQLAAKTDNKWFEAFCFNSMALIQANTGQVSEAIDALKQAGSLAPDQIFPWNNLGNLFNELDRFEEALNAFQVARKFNPDDPMSLNGIGNVYLKLGRTDEALNTYQRAIQLAPNFAHAWNGIGMIYADQDQVDAAISAFQKAIDLDNHLALPWISLGTILEKLDRLDEAADAFRKAYELDPGNPIVWNEQGKIYLNTGCIDEAVCAFQKSIELEHGNGWSYFNLAQTYVCKGKYSEAIQLYHKSIKLFKNNSEKAITWSRLGNIYQQKNDIQNAITAKKIALELDPDNEQIKDELVEIHNSLNLQSKSEDKNSPSRSTMEIAALQRFLADATTELSAGSEINFASSQLGPLTETQMLGTARLWNERGNVLLNTGAFIQATQAYNKAIELDANFGWPYANLAMIAVNNARYSDAIPLYKKSIKLLKNRLDKAIVWNRLGVAYRKMNEYIKAIQAHRKALELDPKNISARQDLIRIHNDLGHIKAAINLLTASLDKASAWNMLGNAYRRLSDYGSATDAFQNAFNLAPNDFAFKFDLEESIKESRLKLRPSTDPVEGTAAGNIDEIKIDIKNTTDPNSTDDDHPGPLGELIEIHPELMSVDGKRFAQIGELLDQGQEPRVNYPISQPVRRTIGSNSTRRGVVGIPVPSSAPAYTSTANDSVNKVIPQNTSASYRNMWHLDEALSSFQKVTESTPVEKLDPALLVYQHTVELVSAGSGQDISFAEKGSISTISAPMAETQPSVSATLPRKPLEFIVAEPAPIIGQPLEPIPEDDRISQEITTPTITRLASRSQQDIGKLERDLLTYQTVTGINPKNARAWHTLGNLQRSAGQFDQAVLSLEKAVALDPVQEVFHYHLGLVYAAQDRFEDAVESFKTVIEINPEYNLAHATLAGYYKKLGRSEESNYHMAIARRTMQDEKEYNQACFEAICGNVDKAIELLKIALKEGQTTPDWVRRDPDFDNIRTDDRFQVLIAG